MQLLGGVNVASHAKGAQSCFHCLRRRAIEACSLMWYATVSEQVNRTTRIGLHACWRRGLPRALSWYKNTVSTEFHTDEQWWQNVLNGAYVSWRFLDRKCFVTMMYDVECIMRFRRRTLSIPAACNILYGWSMLPRNSNAKRESMKIWSVKQSRREQWQNFN